MFVFKDMDDYQKNGKNIDAKYNAGQGVKAGRKAPRSHPRSSGTRSLEKGLIESV